MPLRPLCVAVIVADPSAVPVTSPFWSTLATGTLSLCHPTEAPATTAPALSFTVAMSCTVCPIERHAVAGLTVTDATPLPPPPPPPPPPFPPPWLPPVGFLHAPRISPVPTQSRASVRVTRSSCGWACRGGQKNRPSESIAQSVSRFAPLEAWATRTTARLGVHSI